MIKKQGQFKKQYRKKQYSRKQYRAPMYRKPELKYLDTPINTTSVSTTGALQIFEIPARGTGESQRVGNDYTVKSIQMKAVINTTPTTGIDQLARVMIFNVRHSTGSDPTMTDVLTAEAPTALRNYNFMSDYQVLMDKVFALNASGESGSSRVVKFYRKINLPVHMKSAGNAVADTDRNTLYVYFIGNVATGDTDAIAYGNIRITYEDS